MDPRASKHGGRAVLLGPALGSAGRVRADGRSARPTTDRRQRRRSRWTTAGHRHRARPVRRARLRGHLRRRSDRRHELSDQEADMSRRSSTRCATAWCSPSTARTSRSSCGVPASAEIGSDGCGYRRRRIAVRRLTSGHGPHDGSVTDVDLEWTFDSPSTEVLLSHPDGVVAGELERRPDASMSRSGRGRVPSSFFALGIDHIRFGADHLLFLLVLTLAVAGATVTAGTAWRTVKLVTAFTIGHAISLCLAYFDLISIPAGVVEPAIALSIVAAAVARDPRPRRATPGPGSPLVSAWSTDWGSRRACRASAWPRHSGRRHSLRSTSASTSPRPPWCSSSSAALWVSSKALANRMAWVRSRPPRCVGVIGLAWTATRAHRRPL